MAGGVIRRERTTSSAVRRQGSVIGDGRRSGEKRNPWRDVVGWVYWDGDGGRPYGRMILCGGVTDGVGGLSLGGESNNGRGRQGVRK